MALNKYMHPKNIYRTPPDFKDLAIKYSEFREYANQDLHGKVHIDFKNPDALKVLTKTLLKRDFDLEVEIPKDTLIPTLPLRLNYILWIEDILEAMPSRENAVKQQVIGLDVGTGATCIYPLLAAKKNGWKFVGTESDNVSYEVALGNVERNRLNDNIRVIHVSKDDSLSKVAQEVGHPFDFSMCNPPFFTDEADASPTGKGRHATRSLPKGSNCPGKHEAITDGGEVAIVKRMIEDSFHLMDKIKVYTTMLGKKKNVKVVKKLLVEILGTKLSSWTTTEFCQGHTMRWGIAWTTIQGWKLEKVPSMKKKEDKELGFVIPKSVNGVVYNLTSMVEEIKKLLLELKFSIDEVTSTDTKSSLACAAFEDTWSHQRRKRRTAQRELIKKHNETLCNGHLTTSESSFEETSPKRSKKDVEGSQDVDKIEIKESPVTQNDTRIESSASQTQVSTLHGFPLLECTVTLKSIGQSIVLEILRTGGSSGRDTVHQVLQYFKNKLK